MLFVSMIQIRALECINETTKSDYTNSFQIFSHSFPLTLCSLSFYPFFTCTHLPLILFLTIGFKCETCALTTTAASAAAVAVDVFCTCYTHRHIIVSSTTSTLSAPLINPYIEWRMAYDLLLPVHKCNALLL